MDHCLLLGWISTVPSQCWEMKMYFYVSPKQFTSQSIKLFLNEFLNADCTHLVYPIFKTNLSMLFNAWISRSVSFDLTSSQYSLTPNNEVLLSLMNPLVLLGRCFACKFKFNPSRPRQMTTILKIAYSNTFLRMNVFTHWLKFHWMMKVKWNISQTLFCQWLGKPLPKPMLTTNFSAICRH